MTETVLTKTFGQHGLKKCVQYYTCPHRRRERRRRADRPSSCCPRATPPTPGLTPLTRPRPTPRYGEVGEKFDPNLHDALFQMVNEELAVGDIGAVLKTGYTLNERVIRPAQVGAVKAP